MYTSATWLSIAPLVMVDDTRVRILQSYLSLSANKNIKEKKTLNNEIGSTYSFCMWPFGRIVLLLSRKKKEKEKALFVIVFASLLELTTRGF